MRLDTVDGYEWMSETTTTVSFHVHYDWHGDAPVQLLLKETNVEQSSSGDEGQEGTITLVARRSQDGNFGKIFWSKRILANQMEYGFDYLKSINYGCCGADNGFVLYRYSDGAKMMELSSDVAEVEIPNLRSKRVIGYFSNNAALAERGQDTDLTFFGSLTYLDPESLRQQRVVFLSKPTYRDTTSGPPYFDSIRFIPKLDIDNRDYTGDAHLNLWSKDKGGNPSAYSDFSISLRFYDGEKKISVVIPVRNDKLDISGLRSDWYRVVMR